MPFTTLKEDYSCKPGQYRGEDVLWLRFKPSTKRETYLRSEFGAYWSPPRRAWYLPDNVENRRHFAAGFNLAGPQTLAKTDKINHESLYAIQREMALRGYSLNTIRLYTRAFTHLLQLLGSRPVQSLTATEYNSYYLHCLSEKFLSAGEIRNRIAVHNFYLKEVIDQADTARALVRPPTPAGTNRIEISKVLEVYYPCYKYEECFAAIFSYALGMTVKELTALKVDDVDWEKREIRVISQSGVVMKELRIPAKIQIRVKQYIKIKQEEGSTYFFSTPTGPYTERRMQLLLQKIKMHFYPENKKFRYGELAQYKELLLAAGAVENYFT